jgi:hypothetical protein
VAKALKLREEAFIEPTYCPSSEELAALAKSARDDYRVTDLYDLAGQSDLDGILSAVAYQIDGGNVDDGLAAVVAGPQDDIQDYGDLYDGFSHLERLETRQCLFAQVQEIESHGYKTRWARYLTEDKFTVGVLVFFKNAVEEG